MSRINNIFGSLSSGIIPTDIANLQLWLDASDLDGSSFLSSWVEKSPNAYNFQQATGSKQPQSFGSGFGTQNKPYVKFLSPDNMTLATNTNIELGVMTMFFALRIDFYGTAGGIIDKWVNTPEGYTVLMHSTTKKPRISTGATTLISTVVADVAPILVTVKINGASSFMEVNGTRTTGTLNLTPTSTQSLFLGGDGVSTLYNDWSLAEYIMYKSALTDEQVTQVSSYLNNKYGIY